MALNVGNLREVRALLYSVRSKWYDIGIELEIEIGTLESIKHQFKRPEDCLREVLIVWLKTVDPLPAWQTLADALRADAIGEADLAEQVCPNRRSDPIVQSSYMQNKTSVKHGNKISSMNPQGKMTPEEVISYSVTFNKHFQELYPYLLTDSRKSSSEIDRIRGQMSFETDNIKQAFKRLVTSTNLSLVRRKVNLDEVTRHLNRLSANSSGSTHSASIIFSTDQNKYWSFFNYETLKNIIDEYGAVDDHRRLQMYLKQLECYGTYPLCNIPRNYLRVEVGQEIEEYNTFHVLLDDRVQVHITELNFIKKCQQVFSEQLLSYVHLQDIKVHDGHVMLSFICAESKIPDIFPPSEDFEKVLLEIGITVIYKGPDEYLLHKMTGYKLTRESCRSLLTSEKSEGSTAIAKFPYLKTESLTEDEKETLKARLIVDSEDMMNKFAILVTRTKTSLEEKGKTVTDLKVVFKHSSRNKLTRELYGVQDQDLNEAFLIISDYWSFFDHELLSCIINSYCKDLQPELDNFESDFKVYCKRRLCEVPSNVFGGKKSDKGGSLCMKIDETFDDITGSHTKKLECRLSNLLETNLKLLDFDDGCIELIFCCMHEFDAIFPLSRKQENELSEMNILRLYSEDYTYFPKEVDLYQSQSLVTKDFDIPTMPAHQSTVMQEELHYSSNGNSIIADEGNEECTLSKKQSKHLQGAVNDNSVNMRTIYLDDVGEVEKKYEPVLLGKNDVNISSKDDLYSLTSSVFSVHMEDSLDSDCSENVTFPASQDGETATGVKWEYLAESCVIAEHGEPHEKEYQSVPQLNDDQLSLCSDTDRNYQQLYPLLPSSSHPITSDPSLSPSSILPVSTDVNYDECLPYCSSYQPVISKGMNSLSDVYSEDWSVDGILLSSINERRGHLADQENLLEAKFIPGNSLLKDDSNTPQLNDDQLSYSEGDGRETLSSIPIPPPLAYGSVPSIVSSSPAPLSYLPLAASTILPSSFPSFFTQPMMLPAQVQPLPPAPSFGLEPVATYTKDYTPSYLSDLSMALPGGTNPLTSAVQLGDINRARELLEHGGYNVNCIDSSGWTPLHYACAKGQLDMVRMLTLEFNADISIVDANGSTPLMLAALNGQNYVTDCLLGELQSPLDSRDHSDKTVLHYACAGGVNLAQTLLRICKHISPLVVDMNGDTPLHVCSAYGYSECVEALLQANAPVLIWNNFGKTPLDVAKDSVKLQLQKYMEENRNSLIDYCILQEHSKRRYPSAQSITRFFVIGNRKAGKSSLIELLKKESYSSKSFKQVSLASMPSHTVGVLPSVNISKHRRLLFYDFAGDPEYYYSHNVFLQSLASSEIGDNVFIIVVDVREDNTTFSHILHYWFSFILQQNFVKASLVIVGSHPDLHNKRGITEKYKILQQFCKDIGKGLQYNFLHVISYFILDCCKSGSKQINEITKLIASLNCTSQHRLSLEGSILLGLLEKEFSSINAVCPVKNVISYIEDAKIHITHSTEALYPIFDQLHELGILLLIKGETMDNSHLVLNASELTDKLYKTLFSKSAVDNLKGIYSFELGNSLLNFGIIPESFLQEILPPHVTKECLVQLQYCQEINYRDVEPPQSYSSSQSLLFFPALCSLDKSGMSWITPPDISYGIGWLAQCSASQDFFPPRFIHILLFRIVFRYVFSIPLEKLEHWKHSHHCRMWKNGIHWLTEEGVECRVELVNTNTGVAVCTRSTYDKAENCTSIFHNILRCVMETKAEFCHSIKPQFFLLDSTQGVDYLSEHNQFPITDLEDMLTSPEGKEGIVSISGKKQIHHTKLFYMRKLTHWDSLFPIDLTSVLCYFNNIHAVEELVMLGFHLNISHGVLKALKDKDVYNGRRELVRGWMNFSSDPPCWWHLVRALNVINRRTMANEIAREYDVHIQLQKKLLNSSNNSLKPDDEFLELFSVVVGSKWPSLASLLSMASIEVEEMKRNRNKLSQQEQALLMLKKWVSMDWATYGQLSHRLKTISLFEQL